MEEETILSVYNDIVEEAEKLKKQSINAFALKNLSEITNHQVALIEFINSKDENMKIMGVKQTRDLLRRIRREKHLESFFEEDKRFNKIRKLIDKIILLINCSI